MRKQRLIATIILVMVQTMFCSCNFLARNTVDHPAGISESNVYPQTIYPGIHKQLSIDLSLKTDTLEIPEFSIDITGLGQDIHFFPYTTTQGQKRYCISFTLNPAIKPGRYKIPIRASFAKAPPIHAVADIHIASPPTPGESNILAQKQQRLLDTETKGSIIDGNRVEFLDDGKYAFEQWLNLLAGAQHTIYLQTYYLEDTGQTARLIEMLKNKAAQGIDVKLIINRYTQLGTSSLAYLNLKRHGIEVLLGGDISLPRSVSTTSSPWYKKMQDNYLLYKSLPQDNPFRRWEEERGKGQIMIDYAIHEKMIIVDGQKAIMGGRNLTESYFFWYKDLDILLSGPIVTELDKAFRQNWVIFGGGTLNNHAPSIESLPQGIPARLVHSRPWDGSYTNLDELVQACLTAKSRIYLTSQYLALPLKLQNALIDAARKGIDVRILTNSYETGQELAMSLCHYISLNYYRDLLAAGVRIYEYGCDPDLKQKPYYHVKQFLFDGKCVAVGSYNLSLRSAYLESEIMVYITDKSVATERENLFLKELELNTREVFFSDLAYKEEKFGTFMNLARIFEILY
ncbi:cardiolipin synthetase [hydrocarbon metagenome]|uniref:Cardiolipin synthetase n=1 Tax=hydrocarbon metagenome TaxID=938273 RepID=A0A0W8FPK7_9ZZZZ